MQKLFLCVFLFLHRWKRCQGMKVTGCDGRQFMLLCLNCHLMCMQSGTLTKKDTSSRWTTWMRCEDKQVWSDQTHSEGDLTNLGLITKSECDVSDWTISGLLICLWNLVIEAICHLQNRMMLFMAPHTLTQIPAPRHTQILMQSPIKLL